MSSRCMAACSVGGRRGPAALSAWAWAAWGARRRLSENLLAAESAFSFSFATSGRAASVATGELEGLVELATRAATG